MRAVASAVLWTAVVQLASIAGLWRPRGLADCWGGGGTGGAGAAVASLKRGRSMGGGGLLLLIRECVFLKFD
jgi:hypothetical protein